MTLNYKQWGCLASFDSTLCLVAWTDVVVSREDAEVALGRDPDFEDAHMVSWAQLSVEDASRVLAIEEDPAFAEECAKLLDELCPSREATSLVLYFADPYREH
ncbi:MAG: hypothetical protein Q8Q09_23865 [Deltaproteobacteria bacterium]|nr:hypothetical protein [Deltaproteobacteria bacterium]